MATFLQQFVRAMAEDIKAGRAVAAEDAFPEPSCVEADRPKLTPYGRGWMECQRGGRVEMRWSRRHLRWKRTTKAQRARGKAELSTR
jgi:hypothetical protein